VAPSSRPQSRETDRWLTSSVGGCRLLYGDPRKFKELKIYTFKRYQDHCQYFEMKQRFVEAFIKEPLRRHDRYQLPYRARTGPPFFQALLTIRIILTFEEACSAYIFCL